jgi:putative OPT family oligopeptide transporter
MMQDLKVGHILGGTPWRMEIGEIIGVIVAASVLAFPLMALDKVYHIGSAELPAPQAGLMALMATGIVGGEMAWPLVIVGMFLALGLILIGSPSPMLVAVGMYLPFYSTAAIFVGGLLRALFEWWAERSNATEEEKTKAENTGILLSSGFIAGEALMAVALAFLVLGGDFYPPMIAFHQKMAGSITPRFWLSLIMYPALAYLLVYLPVKKMRE